MLFKVLGVLLALNCALAFEANCSSKFSDLGYSISTVICPAGCWRQSHSFCGTGTYGDGPVCLAAIHAGVISDCGGVAHVYETTSFNSSRGSLSLTVRSSRCGPEKKGYTFQMTCNTTGKTKFAITRVTCPSNCQSNYVCGSDFYTSDSSVCAAAIHSGVIGSMGGQIRFYRRQGQSSFRESTNHNITTSTCGSTKISFNFIQIDDCVSSPCQHGGTCVDLIADYGCICPAGYQGKNCETPQLCLGTGENGVQFLRSVEEVYCRQRWRVIQRRFDGQVIFHKKNWNEYKNGFGNLSTEFWIELNKIHNLTRNGGCRLRVELGAFDGSEAYAEYRQFSIGSESDLFRLHISGYSGTAGDAMTYNNNMAFTTIDRGNDRTNYNCAATGGGSLGAWWYNRCGRARLNGRWGEGIDTGYSFIWVDWKQASITLKSSVMMVRCD